MDDRSTYDVHGGTRVMQEIGVVYTCRGLDPNWRLRLPRFIASYLRHPPGIDHRLYILYKNFAVPPDLAWAREQFAVLGNRVELLNHLASRTTAGCTEVRDDIREPVLSHLNSSSEVMHDDWLRRLYEVFS